MPLETLMCEALETLICERPELGEPGPPQSSPASEEVSEALPCEVQGLEAPTSEGAEDDPASPGDLSGPGEDDPASPGDLSDPGEDDPALPREPPEPDEDDPPGKGPLTCEAPKPDEDGLSASLDGSGDSFS